jgi:hypothetical protein
VWQIHEAPCLPLRAACLPGVCEVSEFLGVLTVLGAGYLGMELVDFVRYKVRQRKIRIRLYHLCNREN